MKRALLLFGLIFPILIVRAQTKLEQILDPRTIDNGGKTLGQPNFSSISSVQVGNSIYFTAYSDKSGPGIWKTDLTTTTLVKSFDKDAFVTIRHERSGWIIYSIYDRKIETCRSRALNTVSLQDIDLPVELNCLDNVIFTGKYLVTANGKKAKALNADAFPLVNFREIEIPLDINQITHVVDQHQIVVKNFPPVNYNNDTYFLLDLDRMTYINLNSRTGRQLWGLSDFFSNGTKVYFQTFEVPYGKKILLECNPDYAANSFREVNNASGNLLRAEGNIGYIADFDGTCNVLDQYNLTTGQRVKRNRSTLQMNYFNWEYMIKAGNKGFILRTSFESVCFYDIAKDTIIFLLPDGSPEFAMPVMPLDEGIFIRYRNNSFVERMYYFPFNDLRPREILQSVANGPYETNILLPLPGSRLLALVNDTLAGAEYAVVDAKNNSYRVLRDINQTPIGDRTPITNAEVLADGRLVLGIRNDKGIHAYVFDPATGQPTSLHEFSQEKVPVYFSDGNGDFFFLQYYNPPATYSVSSDSVFYFTGRTSNLLDIHLYAFHFKTNVLKRVCKLNHGDRILLLDSVLVVVRKFNELFSPINRQLLYLKGTSLQFIAESGHHYGDYDWLEQYFMHNGKLYFSLDGRLLTFDARTKMVEIVVDNLLGNGYYPVLYENFLVRNGEVYFTETTVNPERVIHLFLGFSSDVEQVLWRSNGHINGTQQVAYTDFKFDYTEFSRSAIFMQGDSIYMSTKMRGDPYYKLYLLADDGWKSVQMDFDGRITDEFAPLVSRTYLRTPSFSQKAQNVTAYDHPVSVLVRNPRGNDFYNPENEARMYAFQNGKTPKVVSMPTAGLYLQGGITGNFSYEKQVADKLYNLHYKSGMPQLVEYNLKNLSAKQLLPDKVFPNGAYFFMANGDDAETAYLVMGEDVTYENGYNTLWRLDICRPGNDELDFLPLNDSLCSGSFLEISLNRPEAAHEVYIKLDGKRFLTSTVQDNITGNVFIQMNVPEGKYILSYWTMDECKEVFLYSHPVSITGSNPISGIKKSKGNAPSTIRYTCEGGPFDSYLWTVTGTDDFVGQGTSSIEVRWGDAQNGLVKVVVSDSGCNGGMAIISYNASESVEESDSLETKIFPNPVGSLLNIQLREYVRETSFSLFNMAGQQMRSGIISEQNTMMDVSDLSPGMYILLLNDGKTSSTNKLVIAR